MCVRVCVCERAHARTQPKSINNQWQISAAFQFHFMALAINVIDRRGPSNKMRHQLQPKKTKVRLHYPFI